MRRVQAFNIWCHRAHCEHPQPVVTISVIRRSEQPLRGLSQGRDPWYFCDRLYDRLLKTERTLNILLA